MKHTSLNDNGDGTATAICLVCKKTLETPYAEGEEQNRSDVRSVAAFLAHHNSACRPALETN
jgi:hypothetical protein